MVVTGNRDRTPPAVTGVSASPSTLDLRASASSVTVEVRLRDLGAGIGTARLVLQNPVGGHTGGPVELPMRRVGGTRQSAVWRAVWLAAPCDVAAGEWRMHMSAVDLLDQGIDRDLGTSIAVQNVDRVPPTGSSLQSTSTSVPVAFTEDVVGVSVASAILQHITGLFGSTVTRCPDGGPASTPPVRRRLLIGPAGPRRTFPMRPSPTSRATPTGLTSTRTTSWRISDRPGREPGRAAGLGRGSRLTGRRSRRTPKVPTSPQPLDGATRPPYLSSKRFVETLRR